MRSPASEFLTTIAADAMAPILLVELQSSTVVRYALYPTDVVFNSNTYSATDGDLGAIQENSDGKAPTTTVTLQNLDRVMRAWLDAADQRGIDVVLTVVFADNLDDADAALSWTYELDSYNYGNEAVELALVPSTMLDGQPIPRRKAQGWYCPWSYKGTECAYLGTLKTCQFTYADCKAHFAPDPRRFGGFIGRPQADLVVY